MKTAKCRVCRVFHEVEDEVAENFGLDCECIPCVDASHIKFMRKNAAKLKMDCVPNCPCGFGATK